MRSYDTPPRFDQEGADWNSPETEDRRRPVAVFDVDSMSDAKAQQAQDIAQAEISSRMGALSGSSSRHGVDLSGVEVIPSECPVSETTNASGYGYCHPRVSLLWNDPVKKVTQNANKEWKPAAKLLISAPPFVRPRPDKTNIDGPNSPMITEKNAAEVAKDLRPDADTAPAGRAPRHTYYARHLVERHELFHQADFLGAVAPAWQKVQERMGRVQLTRADQAVDVMTKARQVVEGAIWEVYSGAGANSRAKAEAVPFQSRPGEIRAYADGKPEYEKLSSDIEKRFPSD